MTTPHGGAPRPEPYLDVLTRTLPGAGWTAAVNDNGQWIKVTPPGRPNLPAQGWKLHVSAAERNAVHVLEAVVATLTAQDAPPAQFKVAASAQHLAMLNNGDGGTSQIGKFATVYPVDEEGAVELARRLDAACRELTGPVVPSDRQLRDGGIVSYRYGGFEGRWMQTPQGEMKPAIENPDGELVPDARHRASAVPTWCTDPFEAAGLVEPPAPEPVLIADRYRVVTTLFRSARGGVHLALDLHQVRRCVLKRALRDDAPTGPSARLAAERANLEALAHVPGVVRLVDAFSTGTEDVIVLEDIDGQTLGASCDRPEAGYHLDPLEVIALGAEVATILGDIHTAGFVHRDVKLPNILVDSTGRVRLIDFESAARRGDGNALLFGTVGYVSPEQQLRRPPEPTDDVYALGATLLVLTTGVEASAAPLGGPLRRSVEAVVPGTPRGLVDVIERCLAENPADRYPDGAAVAAALRAITTTVLAPRPYGSLATVADGATGRALAHARSLGEAMMADAVQTEHGLAWVSKHPASPGIVVRDVNTGVAGAILGLAAVDDVLDDHPFTETIHRAAEFLDAAPRPEGTLLGGLYVGEGGVVAALARAAQVTGDERYLEAALRRSHDVAVLPHLSLDLFSGAAGRARLHLWIAQLTGDAAAWAAVDRAVEVLADAAVRPGDRTATWDDPNRGGARPLGYAHGAAGIADVLLDVHEATGDPEPAVLANAVGHWITAQARPCGDGLVAFPSTEGGRSWAPLWCHGAVGIGRFLLHLDRLGLLDADDRWLLRATGAAGARLGRGLGPVLCHGLAGSIDHLIDLFQHDGDPAHLTEAWSLADLLEPYHVADRDGTIRCSSERPWICSPDLTVGYAGVAATWARLADPAQRPSAMDFGARTGAIR